MRITIRTRGGDGYGWGHIARTRLLASAFQTMAPDVELTIAVEGPPWIRDSLRQFTVVAAGGEAGENWLSGFGVDLTLIDLLDIDQTLIGTIRSRSKKIAVFSDLSEEIPESDLTIQPQSLDNDGISNRLLCGPRFFPMDDRFQKVPRPATVRRDAKNLLVCLGGEAHADMPEKIAAVLDKLKTDWASIRWIVGRNVSDERARSLAAGIDGAEIIRFVDDMPACLIWADCALISGGFIKWEAACCGIPSVITALVDHQDILGLKFSSTGAALYAGRLDFKPSEEISTAVRTLKNDFDKRVAMSLAGQRLIDGQGTRRVAEALRALASS
jgi:UDP-2,4-diacetamido-2,4,6-trideoxy-beta-L-altropyranose hydrolase